MSAVERDRFTREDSRAPIARAVNELAAACIPMKISSAFHMEIAVARMTAGQNGPIVATLARAFDRDPILNWALRQDSLRRQAISEFFAANLTYYHKHCCVFVAEHVAGAALWAPPSKWNMGALREAILLPMIMRAVSARRLALGLKALARLKAAHPQEPHYYLCILGVLPDRQGQGVGAALMQAGLNLCDRARLPAYLENSNESNLRFYENHGFELMNELRLGESAPPLYRMWRTAR